MEEKIDLPSRLLKIYQYVYQHPNVTIFDLAVIFDKSTRSIYSYIKDINDCIKKDENKLKYNRITTGYYIDGNPIIEDNKTVDNQDERILYLVQYLLEHNTYTKIETIAEQLFVSMQTIKKDLRVVKKKLSNYQITITHKPYYGLKIKATEINIRKALVANVVNHKDIQFTKQEKEFFKDIDVYAVSYCLLSVFNGNQISIPDYQLKSLVLHVSVALKRIKQGMYVDEVPEIKIKEVQVFNQVIKKCEEVFHIEIPEIERKNLYVHFVTKITYISINDLGRDIKIESIAKEFIKKVDAEYHFELHKDPIFVSDIILHLEAFVKRIELGMENRNPLLSEIKNRYAFEYDITLHCMQDIIDKYGVSEDEIGFFALHVRASLERNHQLLSQESIHIILVCATGLGTKRLVETKLLNTFKDQIVIDKVISYHEYMELPSIISDIVVSTVDIPQIDKPVLLIDPLFNKRDEIQLQRTFYQLINTYKFCNQLFKPSLFKITNTRYQSKEIILKELTQDLEEKGCIDQEYYKGIIQREELSSTALDYLIAIPHPTQCEVKESFIYICLLKKPVLWDERKIQLIFMLGINKADLIKMRIFNHILSNYLDNIEAVNALLSARNFEEFKSIYLSFFNAYE